MAVHKWRVAREDEWENFVLTVEQLHLFRTRFCPSIFVLTLHTSVWKRYILSTGVHLWQRGFLSRAFMQPCVQFFSSAFLTPLARICTPYEFIHAFTGFYACHVYQDVDKRYTCWINTWLSEWDLIYSEFPKEHTIYENQQVHVSRLLYVLVCFPAEIPGEELHRPCCVQHNGGSTRRLFRLRIR